MGNGFTVNGAEISRGSTRHASPNYAAMDASGFGAVTEAWMGAAVKDRVFFEGLGSDGRIIVQEAARTYYKDNGSDIPLPEDWKSRIEIEVPVAMTKYMSRPRG